MDPHDFCNPEKPAISPRKILLIGTLGSGKTIVAARFPDISHAVKSILYISNVNERFSPGKIQQ
jgi:hypothetical protein